MIDLAICARIQQIYSKLSPSQTPLDWLGNDANIALLMCVGSGPWSFNRRRSVQIRAVYMLYKNSKRGDIADLDKKTCNAMYPLDWQKHAIQSASTTAQRQTESFSEWTKQLSIWPEDQARERLFACLGTDPKRGTKVAWMFARDYLQYNAFPIDRHVKRILVKHSLPIDPIRMIDLCLDAGINPNDFARRCFPEENPHWTDIVTEAKKHMER